MEATSDLLLLMQLTDTMFPTGAFVHSNGLETYTQRETVRDMVALQELITVQLLSALAQMDMIILKEAMHAFQEVAVLCELDEMLSAMKPVYEVREASIKIGKQFLRSAAVLRASKAIEALQAQIKAGKAQGHQAVAYGLVYAEFGFSPQTTLAAYGYQVVAGQTSAAMKLLSIGQSQVQALIFAMQPTIQQAVEKVLASSMEDIHTFTPALDIHAMQHEYLFRRLFHS